MRLGRLVLVILLGACGTVADPPAASPAEPTRDAVIGVWAHALAGGEEHRLVLFDSGILGFQHLGPKLPISRAFGRWRFVDGALAIEIAGTEPDGASFPLAHRLVVTRAASTLELTGDGRRTTWTAVPRPWGVEPGVGNRAARSERNWAYLVERTANEL